MFDANLKEDIGPICMCNVAVQISLVWFMAEDSGILYPEFKSLKSAQYSESHCDESTTAISTIPRYHNAQPFPSRFPGEFRPAGQPT